MEVAVEIENREGNEVVLSAQIEAKEVDNSFQRVFRELGNMTLVPGFRRGKAPRALLERYVGKEAVRQKVINLLVPSGYQKAIEKTGLEPIEEPELDIVQLEENKPLIFKARVEVKPEVKLGKYKGLKVEKKRRKVTSQEVAAELERLREENPILVPLKRKKVQEGDVAVVDVEVFLNGKPLEDRRSGNLQIEVGKKRFVPAIDDQLIGSKVGEELRIDVEYPQDFSDKQLAGKKAQWKVLVKELKEKKKPELNNKFAQKVADVKTLSDLKREIKKNLQLIADEEAKRELEGKLIEEVVAGSSVEISQKMVEREITRRIEMLEKELRSNNISLEEYLKAENKDLDSLREEIRPEAERYLKTQLVLGEIVKEEKMKVEEKELEEEISRMAIQHRVPAERMRELLEEQGALAGLENKALRNKALQFLVDNAQIVEEKKPKGKTKGKGG